MYICKPTKLSTRLAIIRLISQLQNVGTNSRHGSGRSEKYNVGNDISDDKLLATSIGIMSRSIRKEEREKKKKFVEFKEKITYLEKELHRMEEELDCALECKICNELEGDKCAFVPCGHVVCLACREQLSVSPFCLSDVNDHLRVYL